MGPAFTQVKGCHSAGLGPPGGTPIALKPQRGYPTPTPGVPRGQAARIEVDRITRSSLPTTLRPQLRRPHRERHLGVTANLQSWCHEPGRRRPDSNRDPVITRERKHVPSGSSKGELGRESPARRPHCGGLLGTGEAADGHGDVRREYVEDDEEAAKPRCIAQSPIERCCHKSDDG
jgi:hypothetical protein